MKTRIITLVAIMAMCMTVCGAAKVKGNGKIVTKDVSVADYDRIEVGQGVTTESFSFKKNQQTTQVFNYTQKGGSATLRITVDENLYPLLRISSTNGGLFIGAERNTTIVPTQFVINGSSEKLTKVGVSGCMDFVLQSALSGDELEFQISGVCDVLLQQPVRVDHCLIGVSGAGDLKGGNLICKEIKCRVSGSGDIELNGKADQANYAVSGSGDIKAFDFEVRQLKCAVSGSGDIKAFATETLDASASGSGDIKYKGNPEANTRVSGSSDIERVR